MNPLAAVPEIPAAQPGVLHDVTSEVTPIVYGMWMRMLRSLPHKVRRKTTIHRKRRCDGSGADH